MEHSKDPNYKNENTEIKYLNNMQKNNNKKPPRILMLKNNLLELE